MSEQDRKSWDQKWARADVEAARPTGPRSPADLDRWQCLFPTAGLALDLACGTGAVSIWLALQGLKVHAVDVSPVAIDLARANAAGLGLDQRCKFEVHDLDHGLPAGGPADVIVCQAFRDPKLYRPMQCRLASRGTVAISVLSEVGATPGRFRAKPGELREAFESLEILEASEGRGHARLLGRKRSEHDAQEAIRPLGLRALR